MKQAINARCAWATLATCAALLAAPAVHAANILVTSGWANGSETFDVSVPTANNVPTGGFVGTYNSSPITFWCAELTQYFSLGGTYNNYSASTPSGAIWTNLGRLFTEVSSGVRTAAPDNSTAFQLAVWEIIYESNPAFNLTSGAFQVTDNHGNAAAESLANTWLANLPAISLVTISLLHSADNQDFITVLPPDTDCCVRRDVPEPSPLPLVALGLIAMGFVSTRVGKQKRS